MRDPGNPRDLCLNPAIRRRSGSDLRSAAGLVVDTTASRVADMVALSWMVLGSSSEVRCVIPELFGQG